MSRKHAYTKDQILAALCRESFFDFLKTFWSVVVPEDPVWNWHIEYLCGELQASAERLFKGLPREHDVVVNQSPGTSKSTVVSVMFPAWLWTRMPECRVITASYAHALALDLARKSRDVIKSDLYRKLFPEVVIRPDQDTKAHYVNDRGGDRFSVGVNGSVTGMHAHFLIVDDPLDPNQALSEAEMRNADNWMRQTLPSRKVNKAASVTVLVMQRLHALDPTGVWLEESQKPGAAPLKHICLPARLPPLEHDNVRPVELRERYVDGLMDPVRMPESTLRDLELRSAYAFAGQFMQSPSPIGGGLFRETYFNNRTVAAPYHAKRIRAWDRAATSEEGCYTVGTLIAKSADGDYYVEDVVRGRWEPLERNRVMLATALRDRARYGPGRNEPMIYIERELGSAGKDAWKSIARALAGFPVFESSVTGSKELRATPWAAQLAAGNVYIVDNGESAGNGKPTWDIEAWVREHVEFPNGKFVDQVDSVSLGFNLLAGQRKLEGVLRTLSVRDRRQKSIRLVVCPPSFLPHVELDAEALLFWFADKGPGEATGGHAGAQLAGLDNLAQVMESLTLRFADDSVRESQEAYLTPLPDGRMPADVMASPEDGRAFWSFLMRPRPYGVGTLVFVDERRRGLSAALAVAKVLRLDARKSVEVPEGEKFDPEAPPNDRVFSVVKSSRGMVR